MREPPNISEEQLRACLWEQYGLSHVTLEFLPRGLDYSAGVYRMVSGQGIPYLLKVSARPLYEAGFLVPRYLNDQGITSVVAPMPAQNNALWTKLAGWIVIVYPFIDGESSNTGMTNEQWKEAGRVFKQIHSVLVQPGGFSTLREETFDPTYYIQWVHTFEAQHLHARHDGGDAERALRALWVEHQSTIDTVVASMEKLADALRSRTLPYVICHADLHAANLIRDHGGHVHVIDWDEVMLAPKERDFIFVWERDAGAFWEGYGEGEIDHIALTYYLWERVMQDLIAYAQDTCFRGDLGEEMKLHIAQMFDENLSERGKSLAVAYLASARLAM